MRSYYPICYNSLFKKKKLNNHKIKGGLGKRRILWEVSGEGVGEAKTVLIYGVNVLFVKLTNNTFT